MSELKAFDVGLGRYTEDGYPCVVAFDADQNPRLLGDEKVYLKSEADQLIQSLKAKIELLQKEKKMLQDLYVGERNDCRIWTSRAIHNKRKRCLALAKWCDAEADVADADGDYEDMRWYQKWHKHWLKIAEKFKDGV